MNKITQSLAIGSVGTKRKADATCTRQTQVSTDNKKPKKKNAFSLLISLPTEIQRKVLTLLTLPDLRNLHDSRCSYALKIIMYAPILKTQLNAIRILKKQMLKTEYVIKTKLKNLIMRKQHLESNLKIPMDNYLHKLSNELVFN